jgi:hypothetical protein
VRFHCHCFFLTFSEFICSIVKTLRDAADLASICARRSSYRARILYLQHSRIFHPSFLMQSLPDFAHDAATDTEGTPTALGEQDDAQKALNASSSYSQQATVEFKFGIQFNAWKPQLLCQTQNPTTELQFQQAGIGISSRGQLAVARSSKSNSCSRRPRTATSVSSASLHGFIASDDGDSSAFSDSSDVEFDVRSSSEVRWNPVSLHFSDRYSVPRRPHSSSAAGCDASIDARSLKQFHNQTSSARTLSTAALLRALSSSRSSATSLKVGRVHCLISQL